MIVIEKKSHQNKEITKLGGTIHDKSGNRMDVNLWFRHKNEAVFYIDSVGKVHGPMDGKHGSNKLESNKKLNENILLSRDLIRNVIGSSEEVTGNSIVKIREKKLIDEHNEARKELDSFNDEHDAKRTRDISSKVVTEKRKSYHSGYHVILLKLNCITAENVEEMHPKTTIGIPKQLHFYESRKRSDPIVTDKEFYSESRNLQHLIKPLEQQLQLKLHSTNLNNNYVYADHLLTPEFNNQRLLVKSAEESNKVLSRTNYDLLNNDKTVTIERKIIRRKKINENFPKLRDSYIDKIRLMIQPNDESSSDSDILLEKSNITPPGTVIQPKTIQNIKPSKPLEKAQEKFIFPIQNVKRPNKLMVEKSDNSCLFISNKENQKFPEDHFIFRKQNPQFKQHDSRSTNIYETCIKDKEIGSSYSARKENMKALQMMKGLSVSSRTLPHDRRFNEMTEDIETITLQPIGKGIQDLSSSSGILNRPNSRPLTPRAVESKIGFHKENKQIEGYNTMPTFKTHNKNNRQEKIIISNRETKKESYVDRNRHLHLTSPLSQQHESTMNTIISYSGFDESRFPIQKVLSTQNMWFKPNLSREEVISILQDQEAGRFIIRTSSTFAGAYGLSLKVPVNIKINITLSDLIHHFLIETIDDPSSPGVRLKGFANEPIYPSLAHLVQDHCIHSGALPTKLILPICLTKTDYEDSGMSQQSYQRQYKEEKQIVPSTVQIPTNIERSLSSPGVNFNETIQPSLTNRNLVIKALYLGKIDVQKLVGKVAVDQATTKILSKNSLKTTMTEIKLDSTTGITVIDTMQKLFYSRHFPLKHIVSADFDPQSREFVAANFHDNGINRGRILGIVVRKQNFILKENVVHLFCETFKYLDLTQIVDFINGIYLMNA